MLNVKFPINIGQRYFPIHFEYILRVLFYGGAEVHPERFADFNTTKFLCKINDRDVVFDFSDAGDYLDGDDRLTFKFHYTEQHKSVPNLRPFSPVSFYDWEWVLDFIQKEVYTGRESVILSNQKPYGNALERRTKVQAMLKQSLGDQVDIKIYDQKEYWNKCLNSRVSVLAPGNSNFMVDRAHMQLFGLGCPVITTKLPEYFPFWKQLEEGKHYIKCADDYSDLLSIIRNVKKEELIEIGKNAQEFFFETSTPTKLVEWIEQCL